MRPKSNHTAIQSLRLNTVVGDAALNTINGKNNLDAFIGRFTLAFTNVRLDDKSTGTASSLSVYPNPSNDKLFFTFDNTGTSSYQIVDISGSVVGDGIFQVQKNNSHTINITDLAQGIYILKVSGASGVATAKFIKIE